MKMDFLQNHQYAIPLLAQWYFSAWGYLMPETKTAAHIEASLHAYTNRDELPLMTLAMEGDSILGTAQLKFREMDIYPEKEHWLGGVFVDSHYREKGVASQLVSETLQLARDLGVKTLYLQTLRQDGGLYKKLGWEPLELVDYKGEKVLVMQNRLSA